MVSGTLANAGRPERVIKQNIKCFEVFKSFLKLYSNTTWTLLDATQLFSMLLYFTQPATTIVFKLLFPIEL
jgi:hypothetical protein